MKNKPKRVYVNTSEYRRSHTWEPRGRGGWLFLFGDEKDVNKARNFNGTYAEARTAAKGSAQIEGHIVIHVLP